eukprot:1148585-Pelagomonas_calceolata.AAC.1
MAQSKKCLAKSVQRFLQQKPLLPTPPDTAGLQALMFGKITKVSGWGGCALWAGAADVNSTERQADLGAHTP